MLSHVWILEIIDQDSKLVEDNIQLCAEDSDLWGKDMKFPVWLLGLCGAAIPVHYVLV